MGCGPGGVQLSGFSAEIPPESLTWQTLLRCYASGVFPMADGRDDPEVYLVEPDRRGVIPLDGFHLPSRLARTIRHDPFEIVVDRAFEQVIDACAAPRPGHRDTWINATIRKLYLDLHERGFAQSLECWRGGVLVGGLYGVTFESAFFGESMFSRERDASKVALAHLVARLKRGGWTLLDAQFQTEHLAQFGAMEISRTGYMRCLQEALEITPAGPPLAEPMTGHEAVQLLQPTTQAS